MNVILHLQLILDWKSQAVEFASELSWRSTLTATEVPRSSSCYSPTTKERILSSAKESEVKLMREVLEEILCEEDQVTNNQN